MDDRLIQFIAGLRAAGVRVSLAESQDAARAATVLGVRDRTAFKDALKATLIKERVDGEAFERLFPLFFGSGGPPLIPPQEALSSDQQRALEDALRALAGDLSRLIQRLAQGQPPTEEEMARAARIAGAQHATRPGQQQRLTRDMLRQLGLERLAREIEALLRQLEQMGMSPEGREAVAQMLQANTEALAEQAARYAGQSIARNLSEQPPESFDEQGLMETPFNALSEAEARELRKLVSRLAARLRSRAALRQKKGDGKQLDAKTTLRANLRTGGVPFAIHFKKRQIKPKFALICDISTSMRPVAEFMLRLMYEMQDQVGKARSFAFNDHLEEVSDEFLLHRPDAAIPNVLTRIPPGYYATDLGYSLQNFVDRFLDAVDNRTTVIVLGDGRNNHRDPRLELFERLRRRAKRLVWFNPEPRYEWGQGDSDMLAYGPLCTAVHQVSNLAELSAAVDTLFTTR